MFFQVQLSNETFSIVVRLNRKYEILNGILHIGSNNISACRQHRNEIPTATPMLSGLGNTESLWQYYSIWFCRQSKMTAITGSRNDITYISASMYRIATKFQRLYPCFRGRVTRLDNRGDCLTCRFVRNRRWWSVTGSELI